MKPETYASIRGGMLYQVLNNLVTVDEDSSDEPIVQINWDALGDTLREFWVRLTEIRIDMNPKDNK